MNRREWVEENSPLAVEVCRGTGLFPETLLAMAITESQRKINGVYVPGESKLAKKYNNFFGIKVYPGWKGSKVNLTTNEVYNNETVTTTGVFCVYPSKKAGFKGYVNFLKNNPRYKKVFSAPDYVSQIAAIAAAGYATAPNYKNVVTTVARSITDSIKTVNTITTALIPLAGIVAGYLVSETKNTEQ